MGKFYLFYGEDDFSAAEALERLKASLGPSDAVAPNTTTLEGRNLPFSQLEMACNTVPFLAEYRLVVVNALLERFEERAPQRASRKAAKPAEKTADEWSRFPDMVKAMPPTTTLVLLSGKLSPRNTMLERLAPLGEVREFPMLRAGQLQGWVQERVSRHKGRITPGAVRLLADFVSGNLRQLDSEVQKLCLYAGNRSIDEQTVHQMVGDTREASIFALVDSLVEGRRSEAVRTLRLLVDQGAAAPYIITMLARQFRLMVQAKSLQASGADMAETMRVLGTGSDFVVQKARAHSQAYSMDDLKAAYRRLLDTDVAIKTGAVREDLGLELLVIDLTTNRRGP